MYYGQLHHPEDVDQYDHHAQYTPEGIELVTGIQVAVVPHQIVEQIHVGGAVLRVYHVVASLRRRQCIDIWTRISGHHFENIQEPNL